MADGADPTGQTPNDLSTTDQTSDNGGDVFDSITSNVVTLAGAFGFIQKQQNSPMPNNIPSNVPSTAPTAPPSKTSTFAGWSTEKKVGAGVAAFFLGILALLGLKKLFD